MLTNHTLSQQRITHKLMRILIVKKKTNKDLLSAKLEDLKITDQSFMEKLNTSHNQHMTALQSLRKVLTEAGVNFQELTRDDVWPATESFDLVITLGGDGTILSSSHFVEGENKTPVLGIRSSDESIGYLCCLSHLEIAEKLPKLLDLEEAKKKVVHLQRLYAEITKQKEKTTIRTKPVLNDFLFSHRSPAFTTRYSLSFNGRTEEQKSSGIWFSTPTGSTAAIGAAGGLKQKISDKDFQYRVRELYSPKGIQYQLFGGLYNPEQDELTLTNHNAEAILAVDGQHGNFDLSLGDKVSFKRATPLQLIYK